MSSGEYSSRNGNRSNRYTRPMHKDGPGGPPQGLSKSIDDITRLQRPPRRVFITHGDEEAAVSLGELLEERCGCQITVPEYRNELVLD